MLDSIYVGLTGLTGYSKDLTVIGANVANINTPGFKASQLLFADLFAQAQAGDNATGDDPKLTIGAGLATLSTRRVFTQGELRQTGNDQDVAIDGNGFFVLRRDGETLYSRAGQFSFDADGFLVAAANGGRVAALENGALRDIKLDGLRTSAGKPTERVSLTGTLNLNDAPSAPFALDNVQVFDSAGVARSLALRFTNNNAVTPRAWLVEVRNDAGNVIGSGELRFNADGSPAAGFNSLAVSLAPGGIEPSSIELFFGDPGSTAGARSLPAASSDLRASGQDGFGVGALTRSTFDENGALTLTYSNGQTAKRERLALAAFAALQSLESAGGSLFRAGPGQTADFGVAGEGPFGRVAGGRIELANVDLAQEFSGLIVSQRGYQASSQIISGANEMIQQLFDIKARR